MNAGAIELTPCSRRDAIVEAMREEMRTGRAAAPRRLSVPYGVGVAMVKGEREPNRWHKLGRRPIVTLRDLYERAKQLSGRGDEVVVDGERYRLVSQTTTIYIPWSDCRSTEGA